MSPSALLAVLLATAPSAAPGASTPAEPETPITVAPPAVEMPIVIDNPRIPRTPTVETPVVVKRAGPSEVAATEAHKGIVQGVVLDSNTGEAIVGASVTLSCECLSAPLTLHTNARGIYNFTKLPSGNYEVSATSQRASVRKLLTLPRGAKFRANFRFDPNLEQNKNLVITAAPVTEVPLNPVYLESAELAHYTQETVCYFGPPPTAQPTPLERAERHDPAFGMQRSLFDGGGMRELLKRPPVTQHLP